MDLVLENSSSEELSADAPSSSEGRFYIFGGHGGAPSSITSRDHNRLYPNKVEQI